MKRKFPYSTATAALLLLSCCRLPFSAARRAHPARTDAALHTTLNSNWNDGSSDGGDEEIESSSDFEDWWAPPSQPSPIAESAASSHAETNNLNHNSSVKEKEATSSTGESSKTSEPSKPLQTLEKLQRMLDDSDYITSTAAVAPEHRSQRILQQPNGTAAVAAPATGRSNSTKTDRLWTSQDRDRYRQQQRRQQAVTPPVLTEEEAHSEENEDTLGYSLPNLPVYMSDADESDFEGSAPPAAGNPIPPFTTGTYPISQLSYEQHFQQLSSAAQQRYGEQKTLPPPQQQQTSYRDPSQPYPAQSYVYPPSIPYPSQYTGASPYGPYAQQPLHGLSHPLAAPSASQAQQFNPWGAMPYGAYHAIPQHKQSAVMPSDLSKNLDTLSPDPQGCATTSQQREQQITSIPAVQELSPAVVSAPAAPRAVSLAEASSNLNFSSIQKIAVMLTVIALGSYASVSPRSLPLEDYNLKFYDNLRTVLLSAVAPIVNMFAVFDVRENDINTVLNTFFVSFTVGHAVAFVLEVMLTTAIRLATFVWFEPKIFELSPRVPLPVLPWMLREQKYRPKRITLFVADLVASCVAAPIVEEFVKLRVLQWTVHLRKNFEYRRRHGMESVPHGPLEAEVTSANQYVTHMLAASLGFKLFDAARRILLYTKPSHRHKGFFAICRGVFPIHELCGTVTAISLAKRDLLGVEMPLWKLLLPAVVIHGMANFRGMKPVFKWNSATPWSEMQLYPLDFADSSTLPQILSKGFAKLMWLILLSRVLGYCIKNYYMVNRQAVKRTTTYAGKQAAFSAELVTADILKRHH